MWKFLKRDTQALTKFWFLENEIRETSERLPHWYHNTIFKLQQFANKYRRFQDFLKRQKEAHPELSQTSEIEPFMKIACDPHPLTTFEKKPILDVW